MVPRIKRKRLEVGFHDLAGYFSTERYENYLKNIIFLDYDVTLDNISAVAQSV